MFIRLYIRVALLWQLFMSRYSDMNNGNVHLVNKIRTLICAKLLVFVIAHCDDVQLWVPCQGSAVLHLQLCIEQILILPLANPELLLMNPAFYDPEV